MQLRDVDDVLRERTVPEVTRQRLLVRPYDRDRDLTVLAEAAAGLAAESGPYPPPEAGCTAGALRAWLASADSWARWVVEVDGRAAGHVLVGEPHPYLLSPAAQEASPDLTIEVEVGRLFLDPAAAGIGAGALLLDTALGWARARGLVAGLAVIDGSHAAQRLYVRRGMRLSRSFVGVHGLNHVFVDAYSPAGPAAGSSVSSTSG